VRALTRKNRIRPYTTGNKITGHRKYLSMREVFVYKKCSSSDKTVEITVVQISSSAAAATMG
jgi:hypothetical protein